ncbi:hypothetical protein [Microbacterium resistens]
MSDYTPTTEEVRADYADRGGSLRSPIQRWAEFDRWLNAHDAEVRAAALAEQGTEEWEYGYELIESDTRDVLTRSGAYDNEAAARHWAHVRRQDESDPEYPPLDILIVRRRKAGPWVPVEHPNRPIRSEGDER